MQVVKKVFGDTAKLKVLRPHELSNWASWIWDNNTLGACIVETSTQLPLVQDTANCCEFFPVVKGLQEKGGAMALRILWDGGLPAAIPYISRLVVPLCRTSTLSFPTTIPSRRGSFSDMRTESQMGSSGRRIGFHRGMRSKVVAESAFPEKREVEQPEILVPHSRNRKGDVVSTSMMSAALTSVLPDYKLIHETAIVHPDAIIGEGVVVSAFCTVGPGVSIGNGCKLHPGSHLCGNTELGEGCEVMNGAVVGADIPGRTVIGKHNNIGYHAVVGVKCQDLKYKEGDECFLYIGNNNDIREYASIHRSSKPEDTTVVGDNNLIMGSCHIAHDCKLGNQNILANGTLVGGHVMIEDYVHTGGAVAIHQFCHIDSYSFLAGGSMVDRDVPMYMMVAGDRAELRGLNLEGMRRLGFSDLEVKSIRRTYQKLFMNSDSEAGGLEDRLADLESNLELAKVPAVVSMLRSVRECFAEKRRGICKFRHWTSV